MHFYFFWDISVIFEDRCWISHLSEFQRLSLGNPCVQELPLEWQSFPDLLASSFLDHNCLRILLLCRNTWGRWVWEQETRAWPECLVVSHCDWQNSGTHERTSQRNCIPSQDQREETNGLESLWGPAPQNDPRIPCWTPPLEASITSQLYIVGMHPREHLLYLSPSTKKTHFSKHLF